MGTLRFSEDELKQLMAKDERLALAIKRIGRIEREAFPDPFYGLFVQIAGQQISGKALERIIGKMSGLTPKSALDMGIKGLRENGLSEAKARAIVAVAEKFASGEWDDLPSLGDEQVIEKLTAIKGIGRWTAEMYLLFTLKRKGVLSYGDYGIRKGICALFGYKTLSKKRFEAVKRKLSPHLSLASLYLWEIAAGK